MERVLEIFHSLDDLNYKGANEEEHWNLLEDAMNAAHLKTRLNFQQHYTPPNENQSPTTSNSGGVRQRKFIIGYSRHPYYPVFYCAGVSTSVPNYTQEEDSGFQTPNVVNLGFEEFNEGNYGFVRQHQFQNSPFRRLSFSMDINNPQRTTRPHVPTTCGTGRHKQQQQPHQDRQ
ncbi:hypothetical protein R3W88_021660 [Solanum pinnatisectum]|uniref:Uncharacterized protein n=1 Tax=Solanum pinnatisectum TaxID=50273 RepID=A0AAV9LTZ1_9SOLN|nr:hypothetical protein R3W88_021660 [Solanum pinnatisectum]